MLQSLRLLDQIDLILQNNDILKFHNLNGRQMFRRLGLGASFVSGNEQQSGVHDRGTVQHGGHQNIVSGTIDERDVSDELHPVAATWPFAGWVIFFVGTV